MALDTRLDRVGGRGLAEPAPELGEATRIEGLIAEEEHLVLQQGGAHGGDLVVVDLGPQLDPAHLGAEDRRNGDDLDAGHDGRLLNWLFRNRTTGAITVGQVPNVALGIFLVAALVRRVFDPGGWFGTAVAVVAAAALLWWAADEILRGVNPFRRLLGAAVLVSTLVGIAA
jgi:hypothetical protein